MSYSRSAFRGTLPGLWRAGRLSLIGLGMVMLLGMPRAATAAITDGPGGPILVISSSATSFSRYFVEILRAEGLNEFAALDLSAVNSTVLNGYDVVILGEMALTAPQVTMLTDWTNAGGTLIAMRPAAGLATLLGITPAAGTLADKYLLVNTASGPGVGIVNQTIQFHGTADLYTLSGATSVATLYSTATTATSNPAVTLRNVGSNGGQAVAFTYDLARSVVYTRQGNPAWAGQDRDGQGPRAQDMFYGNMSGDPQPDWIDLNKVAIPQADEQQRLLANVITLGNLHRKPLPRFWYFPKLKKAVVIMTGDDEGSGQTFGRWDRYITQSPVGCSAPDWECVRGSSYIIGISGTDAQAQTYTNLGFELGAHVNTGCTAPWTPTTLANFYSTQLATFRAAFPSIPAQASERTHCIAWCDWDTNAHVQAANNIRLDTNYYYWPPAWVANRPGYFTGSGMVMRFADLDGTMVDNYQSVTQLPDESGFSFPSAINAMLDKAIGAEGYYGAINCNMHTTSVAHSGSDAIVASAQTRGIPIVSGRQMAEWLDGRNGSSFGSLVWSSNALSFTIVAAAGSRNMKAMLPTQGSSGALTGITRGATPVVYTTETIKGIAYAFFPADAGSYVAQYANTSAPVITAVAVTAYDDGTAAISWTTDEPSTSRVDYGLSSGSLSLNVSNASLVTSHSLTLTGLTPSTTYYYQVTSVDGASNSATQPVPPASFMEPALNCFQDQTAANFTAGTTGSGTYVSAYDDGEVILAPAVGSEFTTLPSDWLSVLWGGGGGSTVSNGILSVDGARLAPASTTVYGPGVVLEAVATFGLATSYQSVGFAAGDNTNTASGMYGGTLPWAQFGTAGGTSNRLYARVNVSGALYDVDLGTGYVGSSHTYRIEWQATTINFLIDGISKDLRTVTLSTQMRPAISDFASGGTALQVDRLWLLPPPYASSGSFLSRVYDAGGPSTWGAATWTADTPTNTTLQLLQRQGNTLVPDGTWTGFTAIASNGAIVGGNSRYIQYQANLATTAATVTPMLRDIHIACSTGADVTAPVISSVAAAPAGSGTSATVTWTTDEAATSRVDYGTSSGSLTLNASNASPVLSHSLNLTGLTPGVTYYYRVTSVDAAANSATYPTPPATLNFTTPVNCPTDVTAADFGLGTLDANTVITTTGDGEVTLQAAQNQDFSGTSLPSGWSSALWSTGGTLTVSGGFLTVDGMHAYATGSFGPGTSLEFVATYYQAGINPFENVGFTGDAAFNPPWVVVGEGSTTDGVYARHDGDQTGTKIAELGVSHRYRIQWNASNFTIYVDGVLAATITKTVTANMLVQVSDYTTDAASLQVDWLRASPPYATPGSFLSRVFDGGGATNWGVISWNGSTPTGTTLAANVRTGNSLPIDGSWTGFYALTNGSSVGLNSRYVQYRADLATSNAAVAPVLNDLAIACALGSDVTAPTITNVVATPAPNGQSATITWTTNELSNSRVDYGTNSGSLGLNVSNSTPVLSHSLNLTGLTPGVTYYYRVTSVDAAANSATYPTPSATLNFATPAAACPTDVTAADFGLGTLDANTVITTTGDGEVTLSGVQNQEFSSLPGDWTNVTWGAGGTSTVTGGVVTVDGARLTPTSTTGYSAGVVLECVAKFGATTYQSMGLGAGDNGTGAGGMYATGDRPWAQFGTATSATNLYVRVTGSTDIDLGTSYIGSWHTYRIEWRTDNTVAFFVDGVSKGSLPGGFGAYTARPGISDYTVGGQTLQVDWLHVSPPYATPGSFLSRVFDAGGPCNWGVVSWNGSTPTGASIVANVRTGNILPIDGSWTGFYALTNGASIGLNSRYIQYRADLATSNAAVAPVLNDLAIACALGSDVTPPTITNVLATPAPNGQSATITWTTNELSNSRVDYGTSAGLGSNVTNLNLVVSHSITLSGLTPATTYYYQVTSADNSSNSATQPPSPASFATPAPTCFTETTAADFTAGTVGTGLSISQTTNGEVVLAPTVGSEFTTLPSDWTSILWSNGASGGSTVSGGLVSVDGARLAPTSTTTYGPGVVLEFVATFYPATGFQSAGFANGDNSNGGNSMWGGILPWAMFGTKDATNQLYSRVNVSGTTVDVALGTGYTGSPHTFRIEWQPTTINFLIDGVSKDLRTVTLSTPMRPGISNYNAGGGVLKVDRMWMSPPYASTGTFVSQVHDGGGPTSWISASWTATVPTNTSLAMWVRGGNSPTPSTWQPYRQVGTSGGSVGLCSRYVQYKAVLAATDLTKTPVLQDVSFTCSSTGTLTRVTDLASAPASGNDGSGRAKIALTWSGGGGGGGVKVYRKGYGNYPAYSGGAVPAAPATPQAAEAALWTLTSVTATGQTDLPDARDHWYYVLFNTDACGNSSAVSNLTSGTLDYLLGDVADGATDCQGNNVVNGPDISLLGTHYGATSPDVSYLACLDVGPTVDYSLTGRPAPDGVVAFDDLVIFALNFTGGSGPVAAARPARPAEGVAAGANALTLEVPTLPAVGQTFAVAVRATGRGDMQALSLDLGYDDAVVEMVGAVAGELLARQGGQSVVLSPGPGRVDLALLGKGAGLWGSGELVKVSFRVKAAGDPALALKSVDARDATNKKVALGPGSGPAAPVVPTTTSFSLPMPNPFNSTTTLAFALAKGGPVELVVYGIDGRKVATLLRENREPGQYRVVWEGRDSNGQPVRPGMYYARLVTPQGRFTRSVVLMK